MRWRDIYEIIWLGDAKNNCNLIEGEEFLRKLRFGGTDKEILNEMGQETWRLKCPSVWRHKN